MPALNQLDELLNNQPVSRPVAFTHGSIAQQPADLHPFLHLGSIMAIIETSSAKESLFFRYCCSGWHSGLKVLTIR